MASFGMHGLTLTEVENSLRGQKGFIISDVFETLTKTVERDQTIQGGNKKNLFMFFFFFLQNYLLLKIEILKF